MVFPNATPSTVPSDASPSGLHAAASLAARSMLPATLFAFATGATALQWCPDLPTSTGSWLAASIAMVAATAVARRVAKGYWRVSVSAVLVVAMFAAGFSYAAWRAEQRIGERLLPGLEGEDLVVIGVVDELPQTSARGTRFAFAIERGEIAGMPLPPRLSLAWYAQLQKTGETAPVPSIDAGERWRLVVRLKRPHGTVNPHGFDVEAWMLENGFGATGYVRSDARNQRLDVFAARPPDWVQRARARVRTRILDALADAPYAGVIVALAIGEQRAIPEAQWQVFNRTGISHLISISGLHVTAFAALAGWFAWMLARRSTWLTSRVPARRVAAAIGALAAAGYVLLAGAQVPAQRTLLMLAVAAVGIWLARPGTAAVVWLWALAVVVAWDPWAGLTPGFWLSFGAVGLLLYAGVGRLSSAPPSSTAQRALGALRTASRAQALITVGLVPLTLALFQQVSVVAPLANALAIPTVTFAVVPLALAAIVVPVDALWQTAHAVFATLMIALEEFASMSGAVWQQHAPAGWAVIAALVGVAWLAAPRGVPGRAAGFVWLLPLWLLRPPTPEPGSFRLVVLDVGQGLAVVVQTHSHALLYDTGPRYSEEADAGGRIVAPFLRASGIERLGGLIVSHQDSDHSGGAQSVLQTVPVDWLATSLPDGHPLLARRALDGGDALRCTAGLRWSWDGVRFTFLHPGPAHYANAKLKPNDLSCVVRVDSEHGSLLLTGDLEARGELELVNSDAAALKSDVLVVPHHGSRTSSTPAFIAAVEPRVAVFTPGYRNRFGHPRAEVVERYVAADVDLFRTDHDGALTLLFAPGVELAPRAEREHDRRYWRDRPLRDATPLD